MFSKMIGTIAYHGRYKDSSAFTIDFGNTSNTTTPVPPRPTIASFFAQIYEFAKYILKLLNII